MIGRRAFAALSLTGAVLVTPLLAFALVTASPLGKDVPTYQAPEQPEDADRGNASAPQETDGVLTLQQALALAMMRNPEFAQSGWEVRSAEAKRLQAGLPPNPKLGFERANVLGTGQYAGSAMAETTISLSQEIPLAGKLTKRKELAALDVELSQWDLETKRLETYSEVSSRFIEVLAAQEKVALAEQALELAKRQAEMVEARIRAGAIPPSERAKAEVQVANARLELGSAQRGLAQAKVALAATWGNPSPRFARADGDLSVLPHPPERETLLALVDQAPDVARWATELGQRQVALELAKAESVPNVEVGAGLRRFNESDEQAYLFQVSVPLPIFDRNQGGIAEARYKEAKALRQKEAAEVRIRAALIDAHQRLTKAWDEARALKDEVLPAARASYGATSRAFQYGKSDFLNVIEARRTLIEAESRYIDALASFHQAAYQAEKLAGRNLSDIASTKKTGELRHEQTR
jgi:cobalt-zinc-cadmium efflux system outer membrane protein